MNPTSGDPRVGQAFWTVKHGIKVSAMTPETCQQLSKNHSG
jgi:hypothetical protein